MKVDLLDLENPGVFLRYLPDPMPPAGDGVRRALALHDGTTAWGAALIDIGGYTVDILSLQYDPGVPAGVCEEVLTQTLAHNAKGSSIQEFVYIAQGTREELESLDDRMMKAGYFPRTGVAQPMETTLSALLQNPTARHLMDLRPGAGVGPIRDDALLRFYNRTHPAIHPDEMDAVTSCCYVEDQEIKAVLHTRRQEGDLVLEWFANNSAKKEVVGWLLGYALSAAARNLSPETRVVLAALPGPAVKLAEKLGFHPAPGGRSTRIYTYYLEPST